MAQMSRGNNTTGLRDQAVDVQDVTKRLTESVPETKTPLDESYVDYKKQGHLETSIDRSELIEKLKIGKFDALSSKPYPGSLLHLALQHTTTKKTLESYFRDRFLKEVGMVAMGDDCSLGAYFVYRIVFPHTSAVDIAEMVTETADKEGKSEFEIISELVGKKIEKRSQLFSLIKSSIRRAPKLLDLFANF